MSEAAVIRIKPYFYIHILDNNTNVTRVEVGPQTFTRQDHEKLVFGPEAMIMIPPRNYCIIQNPVQRDEQGKIVREAGGQIRCRQGDEELRFEQEPFPLYPGEKLFGKVTPLQVVAPNSALKLRASRDVEYDGVKYIAGDEWLFKGPGTYIPRVEVTVVEVVNARIVKPLQALRLKAKKRFTHNGVVRKAGEEYLHKEIGAYIPHVDEEVVETVNAFVLTEKKSLALRAKQTFVDCFGKTRKAGEEWLVTLQDAESHIPDVSEQVVGEVPVTILSSREYAVIIDPVDAKTGKPQLGNRELRKGEASFFLRPGERLEAGIQKVHVLETEEALLLRSREAFKDGQEARHPGDRWMIHGPTDYIPPVQVEIVEKRKLIPLDENEGIYVRDIKSGRVRAHVGSSYMLTSSEELWSKELPAVVEEQLAKEVSGAGKGKQRDQTRVVVYKAPHNTCVQIYDYKEKKARIVWGPDLVMLGPDEQFTVLSLSGDKPKRPHVIKSLALQLGPDFMTDVVIVETADHARLSLKLSYNWHFEVGAEGQDAEKLFSVPDFVGDACKAIAARVRGAVAGHSFDEFHKHSAKLIRTAIFGIDEGGKIKNRFAFNQNKLVITNIDIQSVEPVDSRTRDALQKSVQLAIEITTKSQEAEARHESERREQESRGRLERQKIEDEAEAEKARTHLLTLQAESASVESAGQAVAEAKARADATQIESEAKVEQSKLSAKAEQIKANADLTQLKARQETEISHQKALNELEIARARDLATIESSKFKRIVSAIGSNTLKEIANAGPALQLSLLKGLGLKSFIITDGSSPINLFNSAGGLIPAQGIPEQ
jgi:major vault protein